MDFTLDSFASECRRILKEDPSPVGRGKGRELVEDAPPRPCGRCKVRELVQKVLKDEKFLATYLNDNTPDRQVIYEDPELGFCICAHMSHRARSAERRVGT